MFDTLKKFKYLIIVVLVLVVAFVAYTIYTSDSISTDTTLQRTTVDSAGKIVSVPSSSSDVPDNDLAKIFVDQLLIIRNIDLKTGLLKDPVFLGLVDNHKGIDPQLIGRPNPFSPIGKDVGPASNRYQDINGSIIISTTGIPLTEGSDSDSSINASNIDNAGNNSTTDSISTSTLPTTVSTSSTSSTKKKSTSTKPL